MREAYEKQNAELRSIIEGRLPTDAPAGFARRLLGMSMEDRDYVMSIAAAAQPAPKPETDGDALRAFVDQLFDAIALRVDQFFKAKNIQGGVRCGDDLFSPMDKHELTLSLSAVLASHGQGEIVDALREALECTAARIENELSRVEPDRNSLAWIATEARDAAALGQSTGDEPRNGLCPGCKDTECLGSSHPELCVSAKKPDCRTCARKSGCYNPANWCIDYKPMEATHA